MREKPIIFSTPMIKAILEGRKTMTRRVLKPHNSVKVARMGGYKQGNGLWVDDKKTLDAPNGYIKDYSISSCWMSREFYISKYAPYQPGDILWVRETWTNDEGGYRFKVLDSGQIFYDDGSTKWKPSIFMPHKAARIFLEVINIRVEQLNSISEEDSVKEGVVYGKGQCRWTARSAFMDLWDLINEKRGYSWDSNPQIWVIEFRVIEN